MDKLEIECRICYQNFTELHELPCCRKGICQNCLSRLSKPQCPYCRGNLENLPFFTEFEEKACMIFQAFMEARVIAEHFPQEDRRSLSGYPWFIAHIIEDLRWEFPDETDDQLRVRGDAIWMDDTPIVWDELRS